MPDSSSGATTGNPSALPSWKSSAPQPGAIWQRELDGEPGILAILVALVELHLRQAGPASGAPRHRVVALVDPAAPVTLGQEAPDEVVVLVAEREIRASHVRHAQPPDEHLDAVGDRPARSLDRHLPGGVLGEQVAQPAQLV